MAPQRTPTEAVIEIKIAGAVVRVVGRHDNGAQLTTVLRAVQEIGVAVMINLPSVTRNAGDTAVRPPQGAHGLAALAQEVLAEYPFSGRRYSQDQSMRCFTQLAAQ
jgi:hypothetical protein